jgi:hypothetical protein
MSRWVNRPEGSNWGDFGADDQLGRLNLLTPETTRAAAAEVREGVRFCLSLPLDLPGGNVLNPRRYPPRLEATKRSGGRANMNYQLAWDNADHVDVVSDDAVLLHTQYSTQWDALSHVGQQFDADGDGEAEVVYYNGYRAGEHIVGADEPEGPYARALGVERMAETAIQGRGVLLDLEPLAGRERVLVGFDDMMRAMEEQKVVVESGDLLCLHTGFAAMLVEMGGKPDANKVHNACAVLDGRDEKLLHWISESGIAVLVADNYAVEGLPSRPGEGRHAFMPLHEHCLFKLGLPLGELWYLTALRDWLKEAGRSRFQLTAPPLRLPGAVGSPANPIATV